MENDIVAALTHEVKEEVIENYLYERRLIEEQIKYVNELADHAAQLEEKLYRRFARIYEYLSEPEFVNQFVQLIGMKEALFEARFRKDPNFRKGLRFIKVHGLTYRAKFRKLFVESYNRLLNWNSDYKKAYENLAEESNAVNKNLKKFEQNYDLLTILNFLKTMDVEEIERKHFLGDGFTPGEMASVEATLRFKPIRMEQFKLIPVPDLPELNTIQKQLNAMADHLYDHCSDKMKAFIR